MTVKNLAMFQKNITTVKLLTDEYIIKLKTMNLRDYPRIRQALIEFLSDIKVNISWTEQRVLKQDMLAPSEKFDVLRTTIGYIESFQDTKDAMGFADVSNYLADILGKEDLESLYVALNGIFIALLQEQECA